MINKSLLIRINGIRKPLIRVVLLKWFLLLSNATLIIALIRSILTEDGYQRSVVMLSVGLFGVKFLGNFLIARFTEKIGSLTKASLRHDVLAKVAVIGPAYVSDISSSTLTQLSTEGIEQLESYVSLYVPQFIYSMIAPLTLFFIIAVYDLRVAVILLILVPLIPLSIIAVQRIAKRILNKYWGQYTQLGDSFLENLQGLTTLKVFGIDGRRHEQMNHEAESFRKVTMRVLIMQLNSISVMDFVAYGGAMVSLVCAIILFNNGVLSLEGMLVIILLSSEFFIPMRLLGSYFHIAMNGSAAGETLLKFLDLPVVLPRLERVSNDEGFVLNHVSLGYNTKHVVDDISLSLLPGSMVALCGPSGSGKSTIVACIRGFKAPTCGDASFEGLQINRDVVRDYLTYVGANSMVFKGTLRENIAMNYGYEDSAINNALKRVHLTDFPLDYKILERGSNISGGQKQRIVLARALLKDSPYYIFDEATSNIDIESEAIINNTIAMLQAEGKGILLISHRLSNLQKSDVIYVLDEHKCIASGSHKTLMEQCGVYHHWVAKQSKLENGDKEDINV